mmetsp:Transcript_23680/g.76043  ORF Transcript_23680/g.76043 Transcript_23680/m.76043 type:complete len:235 (+) Transcript_23680:70-774(+)
MWCVYVQTNTATTTTKEPSLLYLFSSSLSQIPGVGDVEDEGVEASDEVVNGAPELELAVSAAHPDDVECGAGLREDDGDIAEHAEGSDGAVFEARKVEAGFGVGDAEVEAILRPIRPLRQDAAKLHGVERRRVLDDDEVEPLAGPVELLVLQEHRLAHLGNGHLQSRRPPRHRPVVVVFRHPPSPPGPRTRPLDVPQRTPRRLRPPTLEGRDPRFQRRQAVGQKHVVHRKDLIA